MEPCPNCGQADDGGMLAITSQAIEYFYTTPRITLRVECLGCGEEWEDIFTLARRVIMKTGRMIADD